MEDHEYHFDDEQEPAVRHIAHESAHTPEHAHPHMVQAESTRKEYIKLAGIFGILIVAAFVASTVSGFNFDEWMRWFMGGFFIVFGSFKLIGYEMFVLMFPRYDLIARRFKAYNYTYPFIELLLGFLYLANMWGIFRDSLTLAIMTVGAIGIAQTLRNEGPIKCACLGNIIKLPLSTVTLLEDLLMAAMALMLLVNHFAF